MADRLKGNRMAHDQATTEEAVRTILRHIGEDVDREGLARTPLRVVKAFDFLTSGYKQDPKDAINGALLIEYLAIIYAWTGEKDRALEQLAIAAQIPSDVSYGQLRLHPYWDPLRGDPRFEKIVASLAPK